MGKMDTVNTALISDRYSFKDDIPSGLSGAQSEARGAFLDEIHNKGRYRRLGACPYCGSGSFSVISQVERRGLPADIAVCLSCDGCFKISVMTDEAARYHYNNISYPLRGKDAADAAMDKLFKERVRRFAYPKYYFIAHFLDLRPGKDLVAELGCNDGANLFPWKDNGFDVAGVELDDAAAAFGRKMGLDIKSGDFMEKDPAAKRPALVIMSHLLEHVSDARLALDRVRRIIGPDGYLFIESPGIRVHGLRNTIAYFDVEHNYNFDMQSLRRLLEERSFRIIYADEYVRFICTPKENPKVPDRKPERLSADMAVAAFLRAAIGMMGAGEMRLAETLRMSEAGSLRIAALSKLQTQYYKSYYSSIAYSEAKRR